jgi:sec-independent protein translocase protein TatC
MSQPLLEHIKEFRNRVLYCGISVILLAIFAYVYYDTFYHLLSQPFVNSSPKIEQQFYIKSVLEGVVIKFKFSILFGIILSIPVFVFHALRFLMPGLKRREKKILILSLISSFILSVFSFIYSYFILLPVSLKFLLSSHFIPDNVGILLTYSENIFFAFNIMAYLAVLFQFPIILILLMTFNIMSRKTLFSNSRYMIVAIFIISAILTPPDVISQLLLAGPLIVLYFIVILISKIFKLG